MRKALLFIHESVATWGGSWVAASAMSRLVSLRLSDENMSFSKDSGSDAGPILIANE